MAAKAHAILSASSSDRWLHCPPSARLCETYEDKGSDYAAEGTDAHALGEFKIKSALGLPAEDPTESLKWYSEEMEDCANGYAEYAAAFLEDYAQTLRRLQRIAGALPLHRIPMLAERGYREIRFSNHEWYFLYVLEGDTAQVRILANDKQDIEALARRDS